MGAGGGGGGENSRYIDGEVPTWENFFDPVVENFLEKDIPVLKKSMNKVTVFHYQECF